MDQLSLVVPVLLPRLPYLLLWVVAGVVAAVRWQRHPTSSLLVVVGASLEVLLNAASAALTVTMVLSHDSSSMATRGMVMGAMSLVGVFSTGCVVAAVFTERSPAATG